VTIVRVPARKLDAQLSIVFGHRQAENTMLCLGCERRWSGHSCQSAHTRRGHSRQSAHTWRGHSRQSAHTWRRDCCRANSWRRWPSRRRCRSLRHSSSHTSCCRRSRHHSFLLWIGSVDGNVPIVLWRRSTLVGALGCVRFRPLRLSCSCSLCFSGFGLSLPCLKQAGVLLTCDKPSKRGLNGRCCDVLLLLSCCRIYVRVSVSERECV
jgi:hypothetical protein